MFIIIIKVKCYLSMKLSDNFIDAKNMHPQFDPNQMYTSDKIVVKHISVKEKLLQLDLNKQSKALLCNCSATDESNRALLHKAVRKFSTCADVAGSAAERLRLLHKTFANCLPARKACGPSQFISRNSVCLALYACRP